MELLCWKAGNENLASVCFLVHLSEGLSKEVEEEVGDLGALR